MPRIIGLARVAEEADIIELFVRHHVALLDHLIVMVEPFAHKTQAILARLVSEGLAMSVQAPLSPGFRQGEDTAALARQLLTSGEADFVIPLDADELIAVPHPGYLQAAFKQLDERFGCWRWRNLAPLTLAEDRPMLARMSLARREQASDTPFYKVILSRRFAQGEHWLAEGHHCVFAGPPGAVTQSVICPMVELKGARLLHMPIRSVAQIRAKAGLASQILGADRSHAVSHAANHWQALIELMERGAPDLAVLQRAALNYPDVLATYQPETVNL
jgi:Glycosyl transferase family 2